jgi:hypothetical protein
MLGYCNRVEVIVVAQIDNRSSAEFSPLRVVVRRRALSCLSRLAFALQGCEVNNPYLPYLTFMYLCIGRVRSPADSDGTRFTKSRGLETRKSGQVRSRIYSVFHINPDAKLGLA